MIPRFPIWQNHGIPTVDTGSAPAVTPMFPAGYDDVQSLLDESVLLQAFHHARLTYPEECCGMILASGLRPCRNAQNDLHNSDPAAFPRTATDAFCFDVPDQIFLAESMDFSDPVRAIYHSHPDGGINFSKLDRSSLLLNGQPTYPELLYLIIDCRPDYIRGAGLYFFVRGNFHQVARLSGRWS